MTMEFVRWDFKPDLLNDDSLDGVVFSFERDLQNQTISALLPAELVQTEDRK